VALKSGEPLWYGSVIVVLESVEKKSRGIEEC
jgi:hypothetical protein